MGAFLLWTPGSGVGPSQTLGFDVVLTENPEFNTQITEHVVEKGTNITDHVRVALRKLTLDVFVSNAPIQVANQWGTGVKLPLGPTLVNFIQGQSPVPPATVLNVKTWFTSPIGFPILGALAASEQDVPVAAQIGLQPNLGATINPQTVQFAQEFDAVASTHDLLDQLRTSVQLITVFGSKGTYGNMVIESFTMNRDAGTGTGAEFTIQFKEIRQVATTIVTAPKPSVARGNVPNPKGGQAPNPINPGSFSSLASTLQQMFFGQTVPQTLNQ